MLSQVYAYGKKMFGRIPLSPPVHSDVRTGAKPFGMIQTKKPTEIFIKTREKLCYLTLSITQACSELVRPLMVVPTTGMGTHINVMVARRGIIKNSRRARLFWILFGGHRAFERMSKVTPMNELIE